MKDKHKKEELGWKIRATCDCLKPKPIATFIDEEEALRYLAVLVKRAIKRTVPLELELFNPYGDVVYSITCKEYSKDPDAT